MPLVAWLPARATSKLRRLAVAAESSRAWVALFARRGGARRFSGGAAPAPGTFSNELSIRILKRRGAAADAPLALAVKRPVHALGRAAFPAPAAATLEAIGAWACQFTPKVSLEPPQALLLEVEGSLRLFGGCLFSSRNCNPVSRKWASTRRSPPPRRRARRSGSHAQAASASTSRPRGVMSR
jgi:hypothetical protein